MIHEHTRHGGDRRDVVKVQRGSRCDGHVRRNRHGRRRRSIQTHRCEALEPRRRHTEDEFARQERLGCARFGCSALDAQGKLGDAGRVGGVDACAVGDRGGRSGGTQSTAVIRVESVNRCAHFGVGHTHMLPVVHRKNDRRQLDGGRCACSRGPGVGGQRRRKGPSLGAGARRHVARLLR